MEWKELQGINPMTEGLHDCLIYKVASALPQVEFRYVQFTQR